MEVPQSYMGHGSYDSLSYNVTHVSTVDYYKNRLRTDLDTEFQNFYNNYYSNSTEDFFELSSVAQLLNSSSTNVKMYNFLMDLSQGFSHSFGTAGFINYEYLKNKKLIPAPFLYRGMGYFNKTKSIEWTYKIIIVQYLIMYNEYCVVQNVQIEYDLSSASSQYSDFLSNNDVPFSLNIVQNIDLFNEYVLDIYNQLQKNEKDNYDHLYNVLQKYLYCHFFVDQNNIVGEFKKYETGRTYIIKYLLLKVYDYDWTETWVQNALGDDKMSVVTSSLYNIFKFLDTNSHSYFESEIELFEHLIKSAYLLRNDEQYYNVIQIISAYIWVYIQNPYKKVAKIFVYLEKNAYNSLVELRYYFNRILRAVPFEGNFDKDSINYSDPDLFVALNYTYLFTMAKKYKDLQECDMIFKGTKTQMLKYLESSGSEYLQNDSIFFLKMSWDSNKGLLLNYSQDFYMDLVAVTFPIAMSTNFSNVHNLYEIRQSSCILHYDTSVQMQTHYYYKEYVRYIQYRISIKSNNLLKNDTMDIMKKQLMLVFSTRVYKNIMRYMAQLNQTNYSSSMKRGDRLVAGAELIQNSTNKKFLFDLDAIYFMLFGILEYESYFSNLNKSYALRHCYQMGLDYHEKNKQKYLYTPYYSYDLANASILDKITFFISNYYIDNLIIDYERESKTNIQLKTTCRNKDNKENKDNKVIECSQVINQNLEELKQLYPHCECKIEKNTTHPLYLFKTIYFRTFLNVVYKKFKMIIFIFTVSRNVESLKKYRPEFYEEFSQFVVAYNESENPYFYALFEETKPGVDFMQLFYEMINYGSNYNDFTLVLLSRNIKLGYSLYTVNASIKYLVKKYIELIYFYQTEIPTLDTTSAENLVNNLYYESEPKHNSKYSKEFYVDVETVDFDQKTDFKDVNKINSKILWEMNTELNDYIRNQKY